MERVIHLESADIKYWIEESPHNKIDNFEEKCYECEVKKIGRVQNQRIAMELNLHKNVNSYGVLEVDFKPEIDSNILKVKIAYTKQNRILYKSDLVKYDTYMYCGLPEEYQKALFDKIKKYVEKNRFSGGELTIPFAVNSEVRSSLRFFEIMIEILMKFLEKNTSIAMEESDNYDDIIKDLFLNSAFFRDKSERKEQRK